MIKFIFIIGLAAYVFLLAMLIISEKNRKFQFWPPPSKNTWQYQSLWWSIRIIVLSIIWTIYTDHSTMGIPLWLRYYLAMPFFILSFILGFIAAFQLGWKNTHGEAAEFISTGFYKFSRNPQYVFFSISFFCLGVWADSLYAFNLLFLLALSYLFAPFLEENWLEKQYGKKYLNYKDRVPRYFGKPTT